MNKVLLNYYMVAPNIRKELIEKVLFNNSIGNHDKIIEYSDPLFLIIFGNFKNILEIKNKQIILLDSFKKNNDDIKKLIDNKNEPKINEIMLYRFEIFCDNYFNKILKEEIKKKM